MRVWDLQVLGSGHCILKSKWDLVGGLVDHYNPGPVQWPETLLKVVVDTLLWWGINVMDSLPFRHEPC